MGLRGLIGNRALLVFMLGHFTVDMYSGILPIMFPIFVDEFDLSNQSVGFIALAFTAAASLSQPPFGYIGDRFGGKHIAVASMAWTAIMVGLIGIAPSYWLIVVLAMMAGLGSGAYHPQGASSASEVVGDENRNAALAFYTVGGTSGYALGPVIGAAVVVLLGKTGLILLIPYGVFVSFALYRQFTNLGLGLPRTAALGGAARGAITWAPLILVVTVVMLRSWVFSSVVSFIPLWFDQQGYGPGFYSVLQTLFLGVGAAGTLSGGFLADRFGQKRVLIISLAGSIPLLLIFASFPGRQSLLLGPAFAFVADMSISITLVLAQRFLPGRIGVASGFILGIGFVTGGIGVPVTGALADRYGFDTAIMLSSLILALAAAVALLIPRRSTMPGSVSSVEQVA